jgi:hypothetical protein
LFLLLAECCAGLFHFALSLNVGYYKANMNNSGMTLPHQGNYSDNIYAALQQRSDVSIMPKIGVAASDADARREVIYLALRRLPPAQTQEFMLALACAPEVIIIDSQVTRFIRDSINTIAVSSISSVAGSANAINNLDHALLNSTFWPCALEAALRVCTYWKERFHLFATKATLHMTHTDEAQMLTALEHCLLQAGLCTYSNPHPARESQSICMLIDLDIVCNYLPLTNMTDILMGMGTNAISIANMDSFNRCIFYQLSLIAITRVSTSDNVLANIEDKPVNVHVSIACTQADDPNAAFMLPKVEPFLQSLARLFSYMPINVTRINLLTKHASFAFAMHQPSPWLIAGFKYFDASLLHILPVSPYDTSYQQNDRNRSWEGVQGGGLYAPPATNGQATLLSLLAGQDAHQPAFDALAVALPPGGHLMMMHANLPDYASMDLAARLNMMQLTSSTAPTGSHGPNFLQLQQQQQQQRLQAFQQFRPESNPAMNWAAATGASGYLHPQGMHDTSNTVSKKRRADDFDRSSNEDLDDASDSSHSVTALQFMTEEERIAEIRRRNARYSKILYHRRKIELEVNTQQVARLTNEQKRLLDTNEHLTDLLQQANKIVSETVSGDDDDDDDDDDKAVEGNNGNHPSA